MLVSCKVQAPKRPQELSLLLQDEMAFFTRTLLASDAGNQGIMQVFPKATPQFQGMQMEINFSQQTAFLDEQEWDEYSDDDDDYEPVAQDIQNMMGPSILVDSRSTFNSFNLESLLTNIAPCDGMRAYHCNGCSIYHKIGSVNKLPTISAYFSNPNSLANILSLSSVSQFYRVTMDSQQRKCLTIHISTCEAVSST